MVAIRYADGVVMAGDRRATAGYTIANRRIDKVFAADDFSGVAIAGAAGPAIEMVKLFQTQLEHYEKVQGEVLSLEGKANQLGMLVRGNLPGRDAGPRGRAAVRRLRPAPRASAASSPTTSPAAATRSRLPGAGLGQRPRPQLDQGRAGPTACRSTTRSTLAIRALFAAADEDVATGGPDLVRGIFPLVAAIDADGFRALDDADVEAAGAPQGPTAEASSKARRRSAGPDIRDAVP